MKLTFGELKNLFPRNTIGDETTVVTGMTQDTRTLKPGELYVAIRGERRDGHDFVAEAFGKGAATALVDRPGFSAANCLYDADAVRGMGRIAAFHRAKFTQPVIAVTGSSGKTTTKDLLVLVLGAGGRVVATEGNLNNHIGVPLTVARFTEEADFFVVEMGMNHPGEIKALAEIARPTHALITCIGRAHMEGVGSLESVAKAKGELFAGLASGHTAFVSADDPLIASLPTAARRVTYGLDRPADFSACEVKFTEEGARFAIHAPDGIHHADIPQTGRHHVRNALAAFAVGRTLGVKAGPIVDALKDYRPVGNRGGIVVRGRVAFMDDTYNANPDSMLAAFDALSLRYPARRRIALLGGMLELGPQAMEMHREVGRAARNFGFEGVLAFGGLAEGYLEGFGYDEHAVRRRHFDDPQRMADVADEEITSLPGEIAVLVKGSRCMRMERVLDILVKG